QRGADVEQRQFAALGGEPHDGGLADAGRAPEEDGPARLEEPVEDFQHPGGFHASSFSSSVSLHQDAGGYIQRARASRSSSPSSTRGHGTSRRQSSGFP